MGIDQILNVINITISLPLLIVIVVWFVRFFFPIKDNKKIILLVLALSFLVGIGYKYIFLDGENTIRSLLKSGVTGFVFGFEAMGQWGIIKAIWPNSKPIVAIQNKEQAQE